MNDRVTRVGPGSYVGMVLRLYWQSAAFSDELVTALPVVSAWLSGEDLVLFRDSEGGPDPESAYWPHRSAGTICRR